MEGSSFRHTLSSALITLSVLILSLIQRRSGTFVVDNRHELEHRVILERSRSDRFLKRVSTKRVRLL